MAVSGYIRLMLSLGACVVDRAIIARHEIQVITFSGVNDCQQRRQVEISDRPRWQTVMDARIVR